MTTVMTERTRRRRDTKNINLTNTAETDARPDAQLQSHTLQLLDWSKKGEVGRNRQNDRLNINSVNSLL